MTLPPIIERELRVASRLPWTYWLRVLVAAVALFVAAWLLLLVEWNGAGTNPSGEVIYYPVAAVGLLLALAAGSLFTADSVSTEKRDGTLGLLFLTDLRPHEILLGKFVAHGLAALYCQMAIVPILGLSLLMGGISMSDCIRMAAVLMVVTFTSLSLGLLSSVLTREVRRAVGVNTLLSLAAWGGGFVVYGVLLLIHLWRGGGDVPNGWNDWLLTLNPFAAFTASRSMLPGVTWTREYLQSLAFSGGCGVVALLVATWRLPRCWQDRGARPARRGVSGMLQRLRFPGPGMADRFRGRLLDVNPVLWLSARHWIRGWLVWAVLFVVVALSVVFTWEVFRSEVDPGFKAGAVLIGALMASAVVIHLVLKSWMANEAPRQFLEDRATGAMELLLTTSLTDREILDGRWRALRRQFLGPMVATLCLDSVILVGIGITGQDSFGVGFVILSMAFLVLDLWAIGWLGLWAGVSGSGRTVASSVMSRIVVLPVLVWIPLMALAASGGSGESAFALWAIVATVNSVVWGARSRLQLGERFREMAIQRPVARGGFLGWFARNEKPGPRPMA